MWVLGCVGCAVPGGEGRAAEGANPDTWWEKYGVGNGGRLEVSVGDDYPFIFSMMDARGYDTVGALPLRNLKDSEGNQYLCYTPLQGMESSVPRQEACLLLVGRSALKR